MAKIALKFQPTPFPANLTLLLFHPFFSKTWGGGVGCKPAWLEWLTNLLYKSLTFNAWSRVCKSIKMEVLSQQTSHLEFLLKWRFGIQKPELGPRLLHFEQVLRWYYCYQSTDHTWSTKQLHNSRSLKAPVAGHHLPTSWAFLSYLLPTPTPVVCSSGPSVHSPHTLPCLPFPPHQPPSGNFHWCSPLPEKRGFRGLHARGRSSRSSPSTSTLLQRHSGRSKDLAHLFAERTVHYLKHKLSV